MQSIPACTRPAPPWIRWLAPFYFLDHVGVGVPDKATDASERLAAPIAQFSSLGVDQLRGGIGTLGHCTFDPNLPASHAALPESLASKVEAGANVCNRLDWARN